MINKAIIAKMFLTFIFKFSYYNSFGVKTIINTYTGSFIEEFILNNESYINLFAALITILGFGVNTIKNIITRKKKSQLYIKETNKQEVNVQINIVVENHENIYNDYSKNNILDIKFEEKN